MLWKYNGDIRNNNFITSLFFHYLDIPPLALSLTKKTTYLRYLHFSRYLHNYVYYIYVGKYSNVFSLDFITFTNEQSSYTKTDTWLFCTFTNYSCNSDNNISSSLILVVTSPPIIQSIQTSPLIIRTSSPIIKTTPPINKTYLPIIQTSPLIIQTSPPIVQTSPPIIVVQMYAHGLEDCFV